MRLSIWMSHGCHMDVSWLLYPYLMACDIHVTAMAVIWMSHETVHITCLMAVIWMSHGCYMDVSWLLYGCLMAVIWMSHGCYMDVSWLLYECLMDAIWLSIHV